MIFFDEKRKNFECEFAEIKMKVELMMSILSKVHRGLAMLKIHLSISFSNSIQS